MKQLWLRGQSVNARGNHTYRYHWQADYENGFDRTELIFDSSGKLMAIDARPGTRRAASPEPDSEPEPA